MPSFNKSFSMPEFSMGFAKGLPKGVYESGEGLLFFLSDCVTHPIQTCEQMWEALTLLNNLARSEEWTAIGEALAPEIHQLITQWDSIANFKSLSYPSLRIFSFSLEF